MSDLLQPPSSTPPAPRASSHEGITPAEVFSVIGPKPIEEFSDEELDALEETAIETPMHAITAGGVLAVIACVPPASVPFTHLMVPDPED